MKLILIKPVCSPAEAEERIGRIESMAFAALLSENKEIRTEMVIRTAKELESQLLTGRLRKQRILFSVCLNRYGMNLELFAMIQAIRKSGGGFAGSRGIILTDGKGDFDTKETARMIAAAANEAGCAFIGMPVVEGTGSLYNYKILAENMRMKREEAYGFALTDRIRRLFDTEKGIEKKTCLLCLHASTGPRSNTWMLWEMIRKHLSAKIRVEEIDLFGEEIRDCAGCSYQRCMSYAGRDRCYYTDMITGKVYPAVERCTAVMILAPNYNDAVGANLSACLNRLTAPYRVKPFYGKYMFSVIVSGYSGGDVVQKQLIDGWNMNKGFFLPERFAFHETMNEPRGVMKLPGIQERTAAYASHIEKIIL